MADKLRRVFRVRVVAVMAILMLLSPACGTARTTESTISCGADEIGAPPDCFPVPPAPAAPGKTWQVVFSEDFSGDDYDRTKLTPCFDWNHGQCTSSFNKGRETYKPDQVRVSNGTAKLVAEPLLPPEPNESCFEDLCTYRAGLLSTARPRADDGSPYLFDFTYGYVESRMKYPAVPGFFTAFWMLPTDPTYAYQSEIDIAEILGGAPATVYQTYHYDNRAQSHRVNGAENDNGGCPVRDYSQDWVKFGVDWQPDHIAWYINGIKCGEFTDAAKIANQPMQLIIQLMIDNQWERDFNSVLTDQTAVDQLEVDYIRVYQQK